MIEVSGLEDVGQDLARPECVLCTENGRVYTSDWRGGVTVIEPDGSQWSLLGRLPEFDLLPNGFCLLEDRSLLLAHLGTEQGGVFRLTEAGQLSPVLLEVDGMALPPTNFVHLDTQGRIWITVSTHHVPRATAYRRQVANGFIVLMDRDGARIVADGLGYTNECVVHPDGSRLFVNETFSRRLTCFDIAADGELANRTTVMEFGPGTFPDGLAFDEAGGMWVTSIVSNRVIRVDPDGRAETMLEDSDSEHLDRVEKAYRNDSMGRPHLDQAQSSRLRNISSLAFGGPQRNYGYLGCLLGTEIHRFRSPIAGHPPAHWRFPGPRGPA